MLGFHVVTNCDEDASESRRRLDNPTGREIRSGEKPKQRRELCVRRQAHQLCCWVPLGERDMCHSQRASVIRAAIRTGNRHFGVHVLRGGVSRFRSAMG